MFFLVMSGHWKGFKNIVFTGSEHKDRYRNFKNLVRNSEYSKASYTTTLLAQNFSFLDKNVSIS